jgi:hypothetical protein
MSVFRFIILFVLLKRIGLEVLNFLYFLVINKVSLERK